MAGIQNQDALISVFGCWPSFHDAEILSLHFRHDPEHYASITASFHLFEMTADVDDAGYYVLRNHTLVELRFFGLADVVLEDFTEQNVLFDLKIEEVNQENERLAFEVEFDPSIGCELSFKCQRVEVVSVAPYHPKARTAK